MKIIASEVKVGNIIKSPFSPYWLEVKNISATEKKITFHGLYVSIDNSDKNLLGNFWQYTFFKTTKITIK